MYACADMNVDIDDHYLTNCHKLVLDSGPLLRPNSKPCMDLTTALCEHLSMSIEQSQSEHPDDHGMVSAYKQLWGLSRECAGA